MILLTNFPCQMARLDIYIYLHEYRWDFTSFHIIRKHEETNFQSFYGNCYLIKHHWNSFLNQSFRKGTKFGDCPNLWWPPPPTELGTPYVFQSPNKLVATIPNPLFIFCWLPLDHFYIILWNCTQERKIKRLIAATPFRCNGQWVLHTLGSDQELFKMTRILPVEYSLLDIHFIIS